MQTAAQNQTKDRLASAHKIRTIDFSRSGILGTGSLSPRARRTLAVYVILVKWDYSGIAAPLGAIADAVWRSSCGEGRSIRTLQRANEELIERGYITKDTFRTGERSKLTTIHFNLDAFAYWTGRRSQKVAPLPTQSHNVLPSETKCDNSPHTTNCHPSDPYTDTSQIPPKITTQSESKPRAGARAYKKSSHIRKNSVLFSIGCVLDKLTGVHRRDRKAARARAKCEMEARRADIDILNHSGVDWDYWEKRWGDIWPVEARESVARREIVPLLLGGDCSTPEPIAPPVQSMAADTETHPTPPSADEIRQLRESLEARFSLPNLEKAPVPSMKALYEDEKPEISLDQSDLAILMAARNRVNGG